MKIILKWLPIVFLFFYSLALHSQSEELYSLNLDSIEFKFERSINTNEITEIYTVIDSLSKPKYIIYVIVSNLPQDSLVNDIDVLFQNSKFCDGLFNQLNCRPIGIPQKKIRGNAKGYESLIEFKNNLSMPGLLFSAIESSKLFHILVMTPNQTIFQKYKNEVNGILDSLEL